MCIYIAIECSYKLDQKNELKFCVNYAHFRKSGHILKCSIKILDDTDYNLGHSEHTYVGPMGHMDRMIKYCSIYK